MVRYERLTIIEVAVNIEVGLETAFYQPSFWITDHSIYSYHPGSGGEAGIMSVILNIKRPCMQLPLSTRAVPADDDHVPQTSPGCRPGASSILIELLGGDP